LLRTELENLRPVYYDGQGSAGGHAFVCDGYQGTSHFHFNWGWNGYANGYYYLNNLNPGGYDFTQDQHAIVNIKPKENSSIDPPTNVMATATDSDITVTWTSPEQGAWLQWDDGTNYNALGLTGGGTFYAASMWEPSDLTNYDGQYLTKISFFVGDSILDTTTYVVKVWQGDNAGTELVSQDVTIVPGDWNEVMLNTPVMIDASQKLWFGFEATAPDGSFPAGMDAGPAVAGKGDQISFDAANWATLSGYGIDRNWNLAGFVSPSVNSPVAKPMVKETIDNPTVADLALAGVNEAHPSMPADKGLVSFNVYRNGTMVANISDTIYTDAGLSDGTYTYCISAVYTEGESEQACADPITIGGTSPVIFEDNFDAYTAGQQLACQNPDDWTTWSNAPCDATEDPYISDAQAFSGPNSVNIVNNNDLVKPFKDADGNYYTTGKYILSFQMYIPSGNDAYWNVMQDFGASNIWGFEAYYDNGEGTVNANGTLPAATFTYPYDTWMLTQLCIDLDNDKAKFMIDGNVIYEWPWSVGTSNSDLLQLAAADFYGYQQTNACSYYMDDFKFEIVPPQPVVYEDDFEAYTAGEMVACQNPENWTTWDNNPCSGTDAYVSTDVAHSGVNSVNIVNDNDLVYPIDDYTEGYYKLSFYTYIPSGGNDGYWNVLQSFNDGNYQWGMQVLYNAANDGEASVDAGGTGIATFNFAYDTWMYNEVYVNLYTDNAQYFVDGNLIVDWQWSAGASGSGGINQLGGMDFYGWSGGINANCNYFFDDLKLEQLEYALPDPPQNVTASVTDNNVTVTWEAPGGGSGGGEFADGFESGNFDAWGEMIEGTGTPGETGDTPYWYIDDYNPNSGTYYASCDWGYGIDSWLIAPPIDATSNTSVSFSWNSSYYWEVDPNDNGDLFVKVSTDGGTTWDELWTFGDIGEWDSWTWYETTIDLSAYAGQTVLVAFNNVGDDNAQVNLDDVYIGENSKAFGTYAISSTPQLDEKIKSLPKDVVYTFNNTKGLLGYNVYRDGSLLAYVDAGQTSYTDSGLSSGTYTYCVSAVYDEGESMKVCADPVDISEPCLPAPLNLTGPASVENGNPIDLMWDAPGMEGWMQWDSGENNGNGIGLGSNAGTYYCASHWMPEDLAPYAGQYLTKIVFYYNSTDTEASFVIKVWKGPNAETELVSQTITASEEWNEVVLDTPVQIDCSQELWFGYEVTQQYGFPAGTDDGPAVQTKGDMISFNATEWVSMSAQYGLDYNFNIAGYASSSAKGAAATPLVKTPVDNPTVANVSATTFKPETPVYAPFSVEAVAAKGPSSYNVYRGGALIGNTAETMYSDASYGGEGEYDYYVTAVYDEGESDPSNTITVYVVTGVDENEISGLSVYPNPARDHLNIVADVNINNVMVYNFAGQVIMNEKVNTQQYVLDVNRLNAGVYMVRIDTDKGSVTKRIIIK
jgi:hypothetical protein